MKPTIVLGAIVALSISSTAMAGSVQSSPELTLEGANLILAAATAKARALKAPGGAIAIVDAGGHMLLVSRSPETFASAGEVSVGKARTAALFRKPSAAFEKTINDGRTAMAALPFEILTPLQGGVPIVSGGKVIGAVGVSGAASAAQDEEIAIAAAAAIK